MREGSDKPAKEEMDPVDWELASLLHPQDPIRAKAEDELNHTASLPEQERAVALKTEADALKRSAHRVEVPATLITRLMKVPAEIGTRWWHRELQWKDAAIFIVIAGIAWGIYFGKGFWEQYKEQRNLVGVAEKVVALRLDPRQEVAQTDDAEIMVSALRKKVSKSWTAVYRPQPGVKLIGGGTTQIDGHAVYFTRYQWNGNEYTLFQVGQQEFGLGDDLDHQRMKVEGPGGAYVVESWQDDLGMPCDWLLVCKEGDKTTARDLVKRSGACRWGKEEEDASGVN